MAPLNEIAFVKGHGTGNDFVVVPDLDNRRGLTDAEVRFLCDRHFGIGADGVLRVVRTASMPDLDPALRAAEFFMDYRNADGSIAEMCGNGARVFARYLDASGLITESDVPFATRGGVRNATVHADGSVTIDMGPATMPAASATVHVGDRAWPATPVFIPNPHAVVLVDDLADAGDLRIAPGVDDDGLFPDGVNVEFVAPRGGRHIAMRVHERGVGETLSCGTGACAAALAAGSALGMDATAGITVDVPGGTVMVAEAGDGQVLLTGPAELVARGTVLLP